MKQGTLALRTWGGARKGAGRKPAAIDAGQPHTARQPFGAAQPVHVTLRVADHVWNLRSERAYVVIHRALSSMQRRSDCRVAHFSVQGNHLHLIVEASGPRGLANGVRALSIRLARGLNRLMGGVGPVFEDRFHAHVLRTQAEVRNALRYVIGNRANHLRRIGRAEGGVPERPDPYSSAVARVPFGGQLELWETGVTRDARSWLLRSAARVSRPRGTRGS